MELTLETINKRIDDMEQNFITSFQNFTSEFTQQLQTISDKQNDNDDKIVLFEETIKSFSKSLTTIFDGYDSIVDTVIDEVKEELTGTEG